MNRLLIVDDDERQRNAIRRAARGAGFADDEIVAVETEADAEAELTKEFALAVVDMMLTPEHKEEGVRLVRHIKQKQPDCLIISLTTKAKDKEKAGARAIRAGACDFVRGDLDAKAINWVALLEHRLSLWKAVAEERVGA